jgi:hypothetical protein
MSPVNENSFVVFDNTVRPAAGLSLDWEFLLKGIFQPIELGSETRLFRSAVINWRRGKFLNFF